MRPSVDDRFFSKVHMTSECWEWTANKCRGYGRFRYDGKQRIAHRLAYEQMVGPIPSGLTIDHLCRNRACVNPDHLEPVTMRENTLRGQTITAANVSKTECPQGHPYDDANTYVHQGKRHCKTCAGTRTREWYARSRKVGAAI